MRRGNIFSAATDILDLDTFTMYHELIPSALSSVRPRCREYLFLHHPTCLFALETTTLYSMSSLEICVRCRHRAIGPGEIHGLVGSSVAVPRSDLEMLQALELDFSVAVSQRVSTPSILLGIARFLNHDCNPNAQLVRVTRQSWIVKATRSIAVGEEITVDYGNHYFGIDNHECACASCSHTRAAY